MSFYNKLCNLDIINIIFNFCNSIDSKTALPCTCKYLYDILRSKAYFVLHQDNIRLELSFIKLLSLQKIYCVNNNCNNSALSLGFSTFLYSEPMNRDNFSLNFVENSKKINRYIPYCKKCTEKFVNYGDRNKPIIFYYYFDKIEFL
jgi:hypothetical protein